MLTHHNKTTFGVRIVILVITELTTIGLASGDPAIGSIVSGGSFGSMSVANGSFATIFGSGLADKEYAAGAPPWPNTLGGIKVTVCNGQNCALAELVYANQSQLNVLMPSFASLPTIGLGYGRAGAVCTVYVSDGQLTSNAITFFLGTYAPDVFFEGYDCLIDPRYQFRNPELWSHIGGKFSDASDPWRDYRSNR